MAEIFPRKASQSLRDKFVSGRIVSSATETTWVPYESCNDYYPKYVLKGKDFFYELIAYAGDSTQNAGDEQIYAGTDKINSYVVYKQRSDFEKIRLTKEFIVIEPVLNGWSRLYENIIVNIDGEKYILHQSSLEKNNTTFDDTFYRFSDLYTFDEVSAAQQENLAEYRKSSLTY